MLMGFADMSECFADMSEGKLMNVLLKTIAQSNTCLLFNMPLPEGTSS
jgi:hypothetical protein